MGEIEYKVAWTLSCPQCYQNAKFPNWRIPRFGPESVKCSNCGTTIRTNFEQWINYSAGQKIVMAFKEYFSPSWLGARGYNGFIIAAVTQWFILFIAISPLIAIGFSFGPYVSIYFALAAVIILFVFPVFPFYKRVSESQKCTKTGNPPVWKFRKGKSK
jgi:hypothetical protein